MRTIDFVWEIHENDHSDQLSCPVEHNSVSQTQDLENTPRVVEPKMSCQYTRGSKTSHHILKKKNETDVKFITFCSFLLFGLLINIQFVAIVWGLA